LKSDKVLEFCEPVAHAGFRAYVDHVRYSDNRIILLSMFGRTNDVNAIWASLVGLKRPNIFIDSKILSLQEKTQYSSITKEIGKNRIHKILIHPDATNKFSALDAEGIYVVGEDPRSVFWNKFNRVISIPLKENWRDAVWSIGIHSGYIKPLLGFGVPVCFIDCKESFWLGRIKTALREGELR
jgi:hypothetical protein